MEKDIEIFLKELKKELISRGALFVGFSDVTNVPNNQGFEGAITIGYKLLDSVIEQITTENGPTYQYFHHYRTVNTALDQLALYTATMIERQGYKALMIPASQSSVQDPYSGAFPHKTAAVLSGNGFIGKNALFISNQAGSKVRLATILCNIPLKPEFPIVQPKCNECNLCVKNCPSGAIKGNIYNYGDDRSTIFDAEKCSTYMKKAYQHIGRGSVCGICIKVCPFNK